MKRKRRIQMNNTIISILLIITVAVPLFFDGHLYSVFDLSKITLLYVLVFIMVGIWGIMWRCFTWNILVYPISAILFSTILSTILSVSPYISLMGTYKRYGGLLSLIVYIILFFAVVEFVKAERIKLFMYTIILTASVASVYGVIQVNQLDPYKWNQTFGFGIRASSTFGHPSFFSAYLVMALPLTLYFIIRGKWWMYPVIGFLLYALFISKTRSAYIGLIVSMIYFFSLYRKKISYKSIGIAIAVIIGMSILMPNSPLKRFQYDLEGWKPSGTIEHRLTMGDTILDIIRDNPVVGIGPDCLAMVYPRYFELKYESVCGSVTNRAHNAILEILATQGIIGLLAWIYLLVLFFKMVWNNRGNFIVISLSSGVVAYMIQNLFSFGSAGITPLFWMLMAMTVIACRNDKKNTFKISGNPAYDNSYFRKHYSLHS